MSQVTDGASPFKKVLSWGGIFVALMGLILLSTGSYASGLLFAVAGMVSWLFAKRRARVLEESQS